MANGKNPFASKCLTYSEGRLSSDNLLSSSSSSTAASSISSSTGTLSNSSADDFCMYLRLYRIFRLVCWEFWLFSGLQQAHTLYNIPVTMGTPRYIIHAHHIMTVSPATMSSTRDTTTLVPTITPVLPSDPFPLPAEWIKCKKRHKSIIFPSNIYA